MDVPAVGPLQAVEQMRGGHGGHAKAHPLQQQPTPAPRPDTVQISTAARLAAERAADEADEIRRRLGKDAARRHANTLNQQKPQGQNREGSPDQSNQKQNGPSA